MAVFGSGTELKHLGAKVMWGSVVPKRKEGWDSEGLKNGTEQPCLDIWGLSAKKADTLQIKWVHTYIIKEQCLWTMEIPCDASWTMRKLLRLKTLWSASYSVSSWPRGKHVYGRITGILRNHYVTRMR